MRSTERELPSIANESILGEQPTDVPGVIGIDGSHYQEDLEEVSRKYLEKNPSILSQAKELGNDLVGQLTANGGRILVGAGLVGLGILGKVLYDHNKENQPGEK